MGLFSPRAGQGTSGLLNPDSLAALLRDLASHASMHSHDGRPVPLITPPSLRVGIRRLIEPVLPALPVVSIGELPPHVNLNGVATWEIG